MNKKKNRVEGSIMKQLGINEVISILRVEVDN